MKSKPKSKQVKTVAGPSRRNIRKIKIDPASDKRDVQQLERKRVERLERLVESCSNVNDLPALTEKLEVNVKLSPAVEFLVTKQHMKPTSNP